MALGMTTIKILRARVACLMSENGALHRENKRLRAACEVFDYKPAAEIPVTDPAERDYGLGGDEWIDSRSGRDTWHS